MDKTEKMQEIWTSYENGNVTWAIDEYIEHKFELDDIENLEPDGWENDAEDMERAQLFYNWAYFLNMVVRRMRD